MYSEDYNDEDELDEIQNENFFVTFYRNNKVLVWILLGIIIFIILMSLLTKGGSNTSKTNNTYDVKIEPSGEMVISIGSSQHLIATVDGDETPIILWSVKDKSIASVDDGVVKAVNYGVTTVTATYVDKNKNNHTDDKTIIVGDGSKDVKLSSVEFKNGDLFMPVGSDYTISLILSPSNAFVENKSFSSSNTAVVTVDNDGVVKAIGTGEATVSYNVNNGAFKGDLKVYVDPSYTYAEIVSTPQSISLDGELKKIKVGKTDKLTFTINPSTASRSNFTWSSSDTSVVTVDNVGNIEGIKEGSAVITVTAINGVSDKIDIEVEKSVVDVTDINLGLSDLNMILGESKEISPTVSPDNASNKALIYSSSNESVAIVSPNGVGTSAKIYALTSGKTTIKVKASNGVERSFTVIVSGSSTTPTSTPEPTVTTTPYNYVPSNYSSGGSSGSSSSGSSSSSSKDTSLTVTSDPNYVYNYYSSAKNNPAPGGVYVTIKKGSGISYYLYGTAKNAATCNPTNKRTASVKLDVKQGAIFEICVKKYDNSGNEITSGGGYSNGAYHYYVNTGYVATPTPKPTYTCSLTYNSTTKKLTMSGSASNGSRVVRTTINDQETSTYTPTVTGIYTGYVYFADGGKCGKSVRVTVATPAPATYTCSLTYNSTTKKLTISGSASNGSRVVKTTINEQETSTYTPTVTGTYTGYVYFADGGKCGKSVRVTVTNSGTSSGTTDTGGNFMVKASNGTIQSQVLVGKYLSITVNSNNTNDKFDRVFYCYNKVSKGGSNFCSINASSAALGSGNSYFKPNTTNITFNHTIPSTNSRTFWFDIDGLDQLYDNNDTNSDVLFTMAFRKAGTNTISNSIKVRIRMLNKTGPQWYVYYY